MLLDARLPGDFQQRSGNRWQLRKVFRAGQLDQLVIDCPAYCIGLLDVIKLDGSIVLNRGTSKLNSQSGNYEINSQLTLDDEKQLDYEYIETTYPFQRSSLPPAYGSSTTAGLIRFQSQFGVSPGRKLVNWSAIPICTCMRARLLIDRAVIL